MITEIFWSLVYIMGQFFIKVLPRSFLFAISRIFSFFYYLWAFRTRRIIRENLKIILNNRYREKLVINTFYNFSRYLIDFLKTKNNDGLFFRKYIKGENIHIIDDALRRSSGGVVILTIHLGNWEVGGGYLAYLGYDLSAVALEHSVRYVEKVFNRQRKNLGIHELPFRNSFKTCLDILREKKLVALLCDRDFTLNYYPARLFGKIAYIPKAPFLLALRAKVPMVFGITIAEGNNYKVVMERILEFKHYSYQEIPALVDEVARITEKYVLDYPDQWFFFHRFWEQPKEVVII
ncbi:MAG: hypothetical protein B6D53_00105 [Candidatus Omnitrophica bacterium 4484_49]|nr:lysophospholipid acyltransferase family protein [Candidatus Omnitrophota bacterium]OQX84292.1 MAG: hypothetical protein B6D53_00105 [Candidatus Omnitrophica bacterium 4484_49]